MASLAGLHGGLRGLIVMTGRGMNAAAAAAAVLAMMLSGCAVPAEYMGIATRQPVSLSDRIAIAAALASETPGLLGCPWLRDDDAIARIPCELVPASQLAGLAWSGDKQAALELGIRFEEGRGVPRDLDKARTLYRLAAMTTGGTIWVWSPGVGDQPGQVIPVFTPEEPGLPVARARLAALPPPPPPPPPRK